LFYTAASQHDNKR